MSIQRYGFDSFGPGHPGGVIIFDPKGSYVLHADHLAAVAEAVAEARADMVDATRWRQGAALFMTSRDIDRVCRLAAAEEREACAKAAAEWTVDDMPPDYDVDEWRYAAEWIAARIRARGES